MACFGFVENVENVYIIIVMDRGVLEKGLRHKGSNPFMDRKCNTVYKHNTRVIDPHRSSSTQYTDWHEALRRKTRRPKGSSAYGHHSVRALSEVRPEMKFPTVVSNRYLSVNYFMAVGP